MSFRTSLWQICLCVLSLCWSFLQKKKLRVESWCNLNGRSLRMSPELVVFTSSLYHNTCMQMYMSIKGASPLLYEENKSQGQKWCPAREHMVFQEHCHKRSQVQLLIAQIGSRQPLVKSVPITLVSCKLHWQHFFEKKICITVMHNWLTPCISPLFPPFPLVFSSSPCGPWVRVSLSSINEYL